jgi:4a-hydroxytetrahydrobiopterin dehydratase
MTSRDLAQSKCQVYENGMPPLTEAEIKTHLAQLAGWELVKGEIAKTYGFKNYYETMAFVNAAAWVSHREDHHPDIEVGYNKCRVRYSTHAVNGLSGNDFICAAKIDALFDL